MAHLGGVSNLSPEMVNENAIWRLRERIKTSKEANYFQCVRCGRYRESNVIDPGELMLQDYTCEKVFKTCNGPRSGQFQRVQYAFRPGSLVLGKLRPADTYSYPGIIEDSPDGTDIYYREANSFWAQPASYWVTFIFPEGANVDIGRYIPSSEVRPLQSEEIDPDAGPQLTQSLVRAHRALPWNLKDRLMTFSYIAKVAISRGTRIEEERGWRKCMMLGCGRPKDSEIAKGTLSGSQRPDEDPSTSHGGRGGGSLYPHTPDEEHSPDADPSNAVN